MDWFADKAEWAGPASEIRGVATAGRRFFVSSLPVDAKKALEAGRSHRNVQNQLHGRLDVQLNEDQCRARARNASENPAILRRIALNMLNAEKTQKRGIKGKQKIASWNNDHHMKLLRSDAGLTCHPLKN